MEALNKKHFRLLFLTIDFEKTKRYSFEKYNQEILWVEILRVVICTNLKKIQEK